MWRTETPAPLQAVPNCPDVSFVTAFVDVVPEVGYEPEADSPEMTKFSVGDVPNVRVPPESVLGEMLPGV
jgi:hypothetical protein